MLEALVLAAIILLLPACGVPLPIVFIIFFLWLLLCIPGFVLTARFAPPFVPTPRKIWKEMVDAANLQLGDIVYDLGCGDGRLLLAAAHRGAKAIGYEYSIPTYLLAKARTLFHKNVDVRFGDFWKQDFRDADVIFCYLFPEPMERVYKEIWPTLKPGTKIISHAFRIKALAPVNTEHTFFAYIR